MNRALVLLLAAFALLPGTNALAQPGAQSGAQSGARVVATTSWVEEWDPATGQWVRVDDNPASVAPAAYQATTTTRAGGVTITETVIAEPVRFIARPARNAGKIAALGQYGPFRVLDNRRAALVDSTDAASPGAFRAMLAAFPGLEVIEFLDAPGTSNDLANLALGRAIRAAGLATHVPEGGSARSGAVELFLAGIRRSMDEGALFAVHSWRDEAGREPDDFAPDAPENRLYLDYYAEMGMSEDEARTFYAMTNSVPHAGAFWLKGSQMAQWIAPEAPERSRIMPPLLPKPVLLAGLPAATVLGDSAHAALAALLAPSLATSLAVLPDSACPTARPILAYAGLDRMALGLLDSRLAFP